MNIHQTNLVSSPHAVENPLKNLRTGQIVRGQVRQLIPNQMAQIQLGKQSVVAQLEIPLTLGASYHFQVKAAEEHIHFKVIGDRLGRDEKANTLSLLNKMGVKASNQAVDFLASMIHKRIPFTESQLKEALSLLDKANGSPKAAEVLRGMLEKGIPVSEAVFSALLGKRTQGSLNSLLQSVLREIGEEKSLRQLYLALSHLTGSATKGSRQVNQPSLTGRELSHNINPSPDTGKPFLSAAIKEQFISHLQQTIKAIGLDYEYSLAQGRDTESIKSMLLSIQQSGQNTGMRKDSLQQLLHYITGMQLESVVENGPFIHSQLQVPAEKLGLKNDINLHFEGRRKKDGEIDPDHCRVLFQLELEHLKQTMIDIHIQKRRLLMVVYNDNYEQLENLTEALRPILKSGLAGVEYQLDSVSFKPLAKEEENRQKEQINPYRGVDYRI
ncbi:hypothetical protein [Virgibacillus sediminis]|uniref:Flagellar hook-length control protein-like C-terminal domain-containing protein n=1 Tax=Virgibacillus sediminis TaxID=202260 RepID=A0ABV7AB62_9BACI